MGPLRFSVRGLLVAVALVGVGMAAFVSATPLWANIMFTLAFLSLAAALVGLCCSHSPKSRAFYCGFFVVGLAYFVASSSALGPLRDSFVTSNLIGWAFRYRALGDAQREYREHLQGASRVEVNGNAVVIVQNRGPGSATWRSVSYDHLSTWQPVVQSAHAWFSIAFGWLGGMLAVYVASRRDAPA